MEHLKFHGIPWNCSCDRNWRNPSSLEFHWTARVSEIGGLEVTWNFMKLLVLAKLAHYQFHGSPRNFMELLVSVKFAHWKFHGIPWNCSCQGNWRTPSFMEFHGTARLIELVHSKIHGIPWNCWCQFHGIPWNPILLFNGTIGIINTLSF